MRSNLGSSLHLFLASRLLWVQEEVVLLKVEGLEQLKVEGLEQLEELAAQ